MCGMRGSVSCGFSSKIDNDGILEILKRIVGSIKLVKEEDFEVLYDARHFNRLMKELKSKPGEQEMPQRENLLVFFIYSHFRFC